MKKAAVFMDGGHVRVLAKRAGHVYDPYYIEKIAAACVDQTQEDVLRVLYYDCAPYSGTVKQPVSGTQKIYTGNDLWLKKLAAKDLFAVRLGVLKFRGFRAKSIPLVPSKLTDADFDAVFEQKGVDMRIGLDIALYSAERLVDRIIAVTADTDCIPAFKLARKAGLQVVLVQLPGARIGTEILAHVDMLRSIGWPP